MRVPRMLPSLVGSLILSLHALADPHPAESGWMTPKPVDVVMAPEAIGSESVLELLRRRYPQVSLPAMNRNATTRQQGRQKDVEAFLAEARTRGMIAGGNPVRSFRVNHRDPRELALLMSSLMPDVIYSTEGSYVLALGEPGALDQVGYLVLELDLPADSVMTEFELVEITQRGLDFARVGWLYPEDISSGFSETLTESVVGQEVSRDTKRPSRSFRFGSFTRGCR